MMTSAIELSDLQCVCGDIAGIEIREAWFFHCQGNGNRAAPRTDICHKRLLPGVHFAPDHGQCSLDEQLRLRARNEHALINEKVKPVKFFLPDQICHRFPTGAPLDQKQKLAFLLWGHWALRVGVEGSAFDAQHMTCQYLGVEAGALQSRLGEYACSASHSVSGCYHLLPAIEVGDRRNPYAGNASRKYAPPLAASRGRPPHHRAS